MKPSNISSTAIPESSGSQTVETTGAVPAKAQGTSAKSQTKTKESASEGGGRITATVEPLSLAPGLYLFSVRGGAAPTLAGGLLLPAVQIVAGPGSAPDSLQIMASPGMSSGWLCKPGDQLVAKVDGPAGSLLLTSIRAPEMTPLLIAVENLDTRKAAAAGPAIAAAAPSAGPQDVAVAVTIPDGPDIPVRIVAHIQNRGDVPFTDAPWAGFAGQRLAIEGFSISPLRTIAASEVECKALSASRSETPWVSGGALCGTRGKGLPLIGFCVRVKPQPDGKRYDCEYSGTFASGKVVGPARNGAPCWSTAAGDFLEALQVKIIERPVVDSPKAPA